MPRGLRHRARSSNLRTNEEEEGDDAQQQSGAPANWQRRPDSSEIRQMDLTTFRVPTGQGHQFGRRMREADETSRLRSPIPSFTADSEPDTSKEGGPVDNPRPEQPAAEYPATNARQDPFYAAPPWDTGDGTDKLIGVGGEVPKQFEGFHVTLLLCRLRKYPAAVSEFKNLATDLTMHPFVRAAGYAMLARLASNKADRKACLTEASRLVDMAMGIAGGVLSRKDTDLEGECNEARRWIGMQTGITFGMLKTASSRITQSLNAIDAVGGIYVLLGPSIGIGSAAPEARRLPSGNQGNVGNTGPRQEGTSAALGLPARYRRRRPTHPANAGGQQPGGPS